MNIILAAQESMSPDGLLTFFAFAGTALGLAGSILLISFLLGQRHQDRVTDEVYESGLPITGSARLRFSSQFYLVAMFFVIFDLEAVFIIAWSIAFEQAAWTGFLGALVFIIILVAVLVYEWKIGALDFGPDNKRILKAYRNLGDDKLPEHKY